MKKTLCLLMLTLVCWVGFGQLTSISAQDDSLQIVTYVRNSRAILDSLTRYEFSKKRLVFYEGVLTTKDDLLKKYAAENLSLKFSIADWQAKFLMKENKYHRANTERWIYRAAVMTAVGIFIRQKIP